MEGHSILENLEARYAVRKFDPSRKISQSQWHILESALTLSPSAYGLQPWKFLVVQNLELRRRLTPAAWNQSQVEDCSHFVVFTSRKSVDEAYIDTHVVRMSRVREVPRESLNDYYQMMVDNVVKGPRNKDIVDWTARQAYIALGTLITTAAMLDIGACPMEGIESEQFDTILNLTQTPYRTVVACAVGYGSPEDKYSQLRKVRFDRNEVIQFR